MAYKEVFNPIGGIGKGGFDYVGDEDTFVTSGADGVTTIRWRSTPGGILYDMTINDSGNVVTTVVATGSAITDDDIFGLWGWLIPRTYTT